ncbi:hypothetical protein ARMGADRAFT_1039722 [Armillaria gallica]|uniref:MYND-type domain-containing protein n=1 Tax=Armillaria gallica TaxID=47427 RepID=A0A2H3CR85_ARMGA|nr:hypothetical protein ARMGADRAFT_1039722 [Armillaria gallica]
MLSFMGAHHQPCHYQYYKKLAKDGSYEAMTALALQTTRSQQAYRAFFCVMEQNLMFDMASIQDMKQGRQPLVPLLDPKDVLNKSCSSMLALATGLRDRFLLKPTLADSAPSIVTLMPAISFWLCLFCKWIILPSRASEFTFIDFHHAVIFILAWTMRHKKVTMDLKLFMDYLPFLWFHPAPGHMKHNLDDAQALFTIIDNACKGRKTSMENHTMNVIHMVISYFIYASILKQSSKAIFKIQRWDVDGFLISTGDPGLQHICKAWTEFIDIASNQCGIFKWILNSSCGNEWCLVTSTRWKFMVCSGCQFTLYCSWKCQRDDWSRPLTSHHSLCAKIKQIRADGSALPMSLSDHEAYEKFNIRCMKSCKNQPSEWQELLDKYIAKNGEPDPL